MRNLHSKKFLTLKQQIELLEERGLNFKYNSSACQILLEKNYFDIINGFETLFLKDPITKNKEYQPGIYFDHFLELYNFDKELNSIVLKLIDVFETRLKSSVSYRFSEFIFSKNINIDPAFYMDILMYENPYSINNRLNTFRNSNLTRRTVNDINNDISKINAQINKAKNKIINYNTLEIQYINKKIRKQMVGIIKKCNDSLENTSNIIHSVNSEIQNMSVLRDSEHQINLITIIQPTNIPPEIQPNLVEVPTNLTNTNLIQKETESIKKELKEFKIFLDKIYSQLASNSNSTINNVNHNDLKNFSSHKIFKTNFNKDKNYIEFSKNRYNYLRTYEIPPFWVIIKTLELGSILKLMYGLKNDVLDEVVKDMGLQSSEKNILFNSIKIINDLRNHCAHFSLINRYRTNSNIRINGNLKNKLNLNTKSDGRTYYEIRLYDTLQVLSQFENLYEIGVLFKETFKGYDTPIDSYLLDRFLNRMGNDSLEEWCNF